MARAWDLLVRQIDEIFGWSPAPAPGAGRPGAMGDGELRAALRAVAAGLIHAVNPARQVSWPADGDPRWRFNLPATAASHVHAMAAAASEAFGAAVTGLDSHASSAALAAVGRLAETLARTRWLLEPADAGQRRERGYALTAEAISRLAAMTGRARQAGDTDQAGWVRQIADRAATMDARLADVIADDGLAAVPVPDRLGLLQAYLPGGELQLFSLLTAAEPGAAIAPSALFYSEAGVGDALRAFQRLHVTRAFWLSRAITLYADICSEAAPVLGRADWPEIISRAQARFRPLGHEAERRYGHRLQAGLHPGL